MNPETLAEYDKQIKTYYNERTAGKRVEGWSNKLPADLEDQAV